MMAGKSVIEQVMLVAYIIVINGYQGLDWISVFVMHMGSLSSWRGLWEKSIFTKKPLTKCRL